MKKKPQFIKKRWYLRMGDYEISAWQDGQSMDLWKIRYSNECFPGTDIPLVADAAHLATWHSKTPWELPGFGIFQNVNGEIVQLRNSRANYLAVLRSRRPV